MSKYRRGISFSGSYSYVTNPPSLPRSRCLLPVLRAFSSKGLPAVLVAKMGRVFVTFVANSYNLYALTNRRNVSV